MKGYFKTTLFGGYDKESVLNHIDELNKTVISLNEQLDRCNNENAELKKLIASIKGETEEPCSKDFKERQALLGREMAVPMTNGCEAKEVF